MTVLATYPYLIHCRAQFEALQPEETNCSAALVKAYHVMQNGPQRADHAIPDETLTRSQAGGDGLDDIPGLTPE